MATKLYDIVVVTGSYLDRQGNTKKQYKTVGAVFQNERGMYGTLDKTFNPAGISGEQNSVFLNFYEPRDRMQNGNQAPQQQSAPYADFDNEIPW